MTDSILTLNVGSSSVKFAVFACTLDRNCVMRGKADLLCEEPVFETDLGTCESLSRDAKAADVLDRILAEVAAFGDLRIVACAHRIVHGGNEFVEATVLNASSLETLAKFNPFAPLHQSYNLSAARALMAKVDDALHVGCFDTAFHTSAPEEAMTFALPASLRQQGIRRYGFHGLSYNWAAQHLTRSRPDLAQGRVVVAHLGSGASLCALKQGESIATTMGLTALDGLPMGTRAGAVDPGAVIYMARDLGLGLDRVEQLLYRESGLLGLSGISNDMRVLRNTPSPDAAFAVRVFVHRIAEEVARLSVSLGGLDALVFTGGIGENDLHLREEVCQRLDHLHPFEPLVIAANEERVMADEAARVLESAAYPAGAKRIDPYRSIVKEVDMTE